MPAVPPSPAGSSPGAWSWGPGARWRAACGASPRQPTRGGCALTRRVLEVPAVVNGSVAGGALRLGIARQLDPVVRLERQRRDKVKIKIPEVLELQRQQHLVLFL